MFKNILFVLVLGNSLVLTNASPAQDNSSHQENQPAIYYIIHSKLNGDMSALKKSFPAHLDHLKNLQQQALLFAAGPTLVSADSVEIFDLLNNEQAIGGDGIIILRVDSHSQAKEIAEADPFHQSGIRRYKILPWIITKGTVTLE